MGTTNPERLKKKSQIIIDMYNTLITGGVIKKNNFAKEQKISIKSVERYIDDINVNLESNKETFSLNMKIEYDDILEGHVLKSREKHYLTKEDILAISKVLLESRGFSNKELDSLLKKLVANSYYIDNLEIAKVVLSEHRNYVEPKHGDENLINKIWDLSAAIRSSKKVKMYYTKVGKSGEVESQPIERTILPKGLLFSEYYFYLVGLIDHIEEKDSSFYIPYRLDRIKNYEVLEERFRDVLEDNFEEGEFRKVTQFMQPENMESIKFRFKGRSIEAILDKIPTARIVSKNEGEYILEARVYSKGVKMFLLSQGELLEVLEPEEFRKEMRETIEGMMGSYR